MQRLIGQIIRAVSLSRDGKTLTITTDESVFTYTAVGDCCAHAYILPLDETSIRSIIGNPIVNVEQTGVTSEEESEYQVIDTEFYSIQTVRGDLDLQSITVIMAVGSSSQLKLQSSNSYDSDVDKPRCCALNNITYKLGLTARV